MFLLPLCDVFSLNPMEIVFLILSHYCCWLVAEQDEFCQQAAQLYARSKE
jgi:hypothetical protein